MYKSDMGGGTHVRAGKYMQSVVLYSYCIVLCQQAHAHSYITHVPTPSLIAVCATPCTLPCSEPQRHYHTQDHIDDMITHLEQHRNLVTDYPAVIFVRTTPSGVLV